MKCNQCKLIEMLVMVRNEKEVVYHCPKCKEILKISVEEEERLFKEADEKKEEYLNSQIENYTN